MDIRALFLRLFCLFLSGVAFACHDNGASTDVDGSTPVPTLTVSGYAYRFGPSPMAVEGAVVSVAEYPELGTTTDDTGFYSLLVPDADVTLLAEHDGYTPMYHQTFIMAGSDLSDVKLQMVPDIIYDIFVNMLHIDPDPGRCQIATTVNVAAIEGMSLQEFWNYGHHGVAGATVTSDPPIDAEYGPVYFDDRTMPDRDLTETTIDGGALFYNVEPGRYTFEAHHPTLTFTTFVVTCEPGRFINACPPYGLHEIVSE